jgi:dihydrofolate reductase
MRSLVVTENISLDGIIAPIPWFDPAADDPELLAASTAHRESADAVLLGRVTYQEFAGYWPHVKDDRTGVSPYLDAVHKYVVSATLTRADWEHSTVLRGPLTEEVTALKNAPGADIVATGSARLVSALLPTGLVDVLRLFVYPVVSATGRRLFDTPLPDPELTDVRRFASGVVLLEYRLTPG